MLHALIALPIATEALPCDIVTTPRTIPISTESHRVMVMEEKEAEKTITIIGGMKKIDIRKIVIKIATTGPTLIRGQLFPILDRILFLLLRPSFPCLIKINCQWTISVPYQYKTYKVYKINCSVKYLRFLSLLQLKT